ncbi:hypothetical protein GCM10010174_61860 [Kutzneria viridogrisea]|uniref:Crossover junction endodeoxyribonuclease RusA n=1 Tax=Kutzneria viridogrisea TaxID=47990 RepID=A0ABR6BGA4_9PSEU|nr:crossover junction endodeoxyribonuclease RusA [Kutzneria viridogrisea]
MTDHPPDTATATSEEKSARTVLDVFVPGHPAPQGSKRHVGGGKLVESSRALRPWRQDIREACLCNGQPRVRFARDEPVHLICDFVLPRPVRLPKRATPPHTKRPDGDKLLRAVCDALTSAGVYQDDAQVTDHTGRKRYAAPGETPGCRIRLLRATCTDTAAGSGRRSQ